MRLKEWMYGIGAILLVGTSSVGEAAVGSVGERDLPVDQALGVARTLPATGEAVLEGPVLDDAGETSLDPIFDTRSASLGGGTDGVPGEEPIDDEPISEDREGRHERLHRVAGELREVIQNQTGFESREQARLLHGVLTHDPNQQAAREIFQLVKNGEDLTDEQRCRLHHNARRFHRHLHEQHEGGDE